MVFALDESGDDLGEGGGVVEVFEFLAPEGEVGGFGAFFLPVFHHAGDGLAGVIELGANERREVFDDGRGVFVPAFRHATQGGGGVIGGFLLVVQNADTDDAVKHLEDLLDDVHEDFDAWIGYRVIARGEEWEVTLEAEDVPWVDEGAALDATVDEVFDLADEFCDRICLSGVLVRRAAIGVIEFVMDLADAAADFGLEADGECGDLGGLFSTGFGVAGTGVQDSQRATHELLGTVTRENAVEVLTDVAEGLSG